MIMTSETTPHLTPNGLMLSTLNPINPLNPQPLLLLLLFPNQQPKSFSFKLVNLPVDLSKREALLIFALVNDDVLDVDVKELGVTVFFKNLNTCITTAKLLDGKHIFGAANAPVHVDYDLSFSVAPTASAFNNMRLSNPTVSPPNAQQHLLGQPAALAPALAQNQSNFDLQKRKSVGNQRSRFLFSDPFAALQPQGTPGSIDLLDLTGKSILMMESHNDAREYENLVRDPWGQQQPFNFGSAPHTPGLAVHNPLDWALQPQNPPQQQDLEPQQQQKSQSVSAGQPSERRTSSAFFNGLKEAPPAALSQPQSSLLLLQPTVAAILSQGPSQQNGSQLPPLLIPQPARLGPSSALLANGSAQPAQNASTPTSAPRSGSKDVPDLSLLARVPPPANPADQNPPCNTLYVGNLPPDATEAELRTLFSPQKGFRRLLFRTKNQLSSAGASQSGHNHGPMCFVEFEDVAHATIALAELYGRALPRPNGSNGKGGIRLSFSKNPLGVRGPGNPRRSLQQNSSNYSYNYN